MAVTNTWVFALMLCRAVAVLSSEVSSESESIDEEKESVSDGVRCYCNSAECVGTSYMCRAPPGGGCYSELSTRQRAHDARYGCLHHTQSAEDGTRVCQNSPSRGGESTVSVSGRQTLTLCCFQDLCNHEDSPLARRRLNLTAHVSQLEGAGAERGAGAGYGSSEVWFKAATIAVPVCGAVIMFLLVGVAVRLLKADAADLKLRAPYISQCGPPLAPGEVKKALGQGACAAPLLVTPSGCLVHVERAELSSTSVQLYPDCDIQR